MKRSDFIKIIRLRSCWKIDRRKGNYMLPNGERLSSYIDDLVRGQLELDKLGIMSNGELESCAATERDNAGLPIYTVFVPFKDNETITFDEMEIRIKKLTNEIIH